MTYFLLPSLRRLTRSKSGQDLIEYALLAGFLAVVMAAVFPQTIGPAVSQVYSKISSSFAASNNVGAS